jgi:acyl carrier protein
MSFEMTLAELVKRRLKYLPKEVALDPNVLLKDYGLDSAAAIDLLLDLEDTFGVMMPDEYLTSETFATLNSLQSALLPLVPAAGAIGVAR